MGGELIVSWDDLVNKYGLKISTNYTLFNQGTSTTTLGGVINKYKSEFNYDFTCGYILAVGDDITTIGNYALNSADTKGYPPTVLVLSSNVTKIGTNNSSPVIWYNGTESQWLAVSSSITTNIHCVDEQKQ